MKKIDSLYLHFPFCTHLCNYCDFYKKIPKNKVQDYQNFHIYLQQSFDEHQNLMKKNSYSWAPLKTLYIGGGTPSLWGAEGALFLRNFLSKNKIELAEDCEFTLEVNPGAWTEQIIDEWEKGGVNRYSLGVQSLDKVLIKHLDRVHTVEDVFDTLTFFKERRVNFSMDFMLGLPFSKNEKRNIIKELEQALTYFPSHFSVYILTVKNNYTHFAQLPTEEWIEKEYKEVASFLIRNGYLHYEVSNFSLPSKESQHNLNYWNSSTVAALGPSATGFLSEEKLRYKWKTNAAELDIEYLKKSEYELEKIYMALRSKIGLDLKLLDIKSESDLQFVSNWGHRGLAFLGEDGKLRLTSAGFLILDSLISELFTQKLIK